MTLRARKDTKHKTKSTTQQKHTVKHKTRPAIKKTSVMSSRKTNPTINTFKPAQISTNNKSL